MIDIVAPSDHRNLSLDDYAADAKFVASVASLRAEVASVLPRLAGRTVWMVNSTAKGGGVAEMLPRLCALMNELGIAVRWAVIGTDRPEFFALTKRIHNLIHGDATAGIDLGPDDAHLYEAVGRENAESFLPQLRRQDIVVVHDPQPLPLGASVHRETGATVVWRCHIGLDERSDATRAAWRFLRPHLDGYAAAIFSAPEYIPSFLAGRAVIVHPAIDPISHKNRDLSVGKMIGILCNGGLQAPHEPVPTEAFPEQVRRVLPDGTTDVPGEMGLLFRPIVLQVSRWDRLKGWAELLEGFVRMKAKHRSTGGTGLSERNRRRIELSRLVLAGPDPSSIADDPEGREVFEDLAERYRRLGPRDREDVAILLLPMASRKRNGLIVNALQRCAALVVQNSIREGFGLTVTEAMWKQLPVLGTSACGIRQQIRDGIDGALTADPRDPDEIASHLRSLLTDPGRRYRLGRGGQLRVYESFLVFRQISRYVQLLARLT